jgi:hypothetical protein
MRIIVYFMCFLSSVCADEIGIKLIEKNETGLLLKNESNSGIFVYMPCSLDFRVISGFDNALSEKTDEESRAENHRQASISKSHGFFVEAGEGFVIDYPPGYRMETFPNKVILRVRYRDVATAGDGKLLLGKLKTVDISTLMGSEVSPKIRPTSDQTLELTKPEPMKR